MQYLPETWTGTGSHCFSYLLSFHNGDRRAAEPQRRAIELRHPPTVARADFVSEPTLPHDEHSFVQLDGPVLPSSVYLDGGDLHLRFHECRGVGGTVRIDLDWEPARAVSVDFLGRQVDASVRTKGTQVSVHVAPWQIMTLRLERPQAAKTRRDTAV
jgi:hypothetical protein